MTGSSPAPTVRLEPLPAPRQSETRSAEPPRREAERRSLNEKFAARLERESGGESDRKDAPVGAAARGQGGRQQEFTGSDRGGEQGDFARAEIGSQIRASATGGADAAQAQAGIDRALIDKMAAQIAEAQPRAASSEAEIRFPSGAIAESALVQREADGSIAIRIAGLDPQLSALRQGQATLALMAALERRRLRVASLAFERKGGDQRGRLPTISRVV